MKQIQLRWQIPVWELYFAGLNLKMEEQVFLLTNLLSLVI